MLCVWVCTCVAGGKWDGSTFDYKVVKLLSVDPANYPDAPREAIRRVLEEVTGILHPKDKPVDSSRIEWIRMGTTGMAVRDLMS